MATLRNKGAAPTIASDVATQGYVKSVRGTGSLTQTEINNQVSTALSPYADATYVATRDLLNATKSQIDAGDLGKLKADTINANNGVAGLDAGGRIQVARVPGNSTQRWPHGFYTPASYHASTVASTAGNEAVMFTHTVADPGYPFRLLISGQFDVRTATTGDAPKVSVRVGSAAGPVVATGTGSPLQYRYGVDTFDRTLSTLGAGWSSFYGGSGSGHTETNGTSAFWVPDGFDANRQGLCRKIADFATTVDDYQEVSYRVATPPDNEFLGAAPHNRLYGRVNSAINSYIAFDMTRTSCSLLYANGGNPVTLVAPQNNFTLNQGDGILAQFGVYAEANKRRFRLLLNGQVKLDYTDSSQVTAMGIDNRGWGFGQQAGSWLFNQLRPAALEWVALSDPVAPWSADPENYSAAVLTSTSLSSQASLVGIQTLYVTLDATSTASVYATTTLPKLHVMAIPA